MLNYHELRTQYKRSNNTADIAIVTGILALGTVLLWAVVRMGALGMVYIGKGL